MRILNLRIVYWHGLRLYILKHHKFVAADSEGRVYSYAKEPVQSTAGWAALGDNNLVCRVDLEGTYWHTTLEEYVECAF